MCVNYEKIKNVEIFVFILLNRLFDCLVVLIICNNRNDRKKKFDKVNYVTFKFIPVSLCVYKRICINYIIF